MSETTTPLLGSSMTEWSVRLLAADQPELARAINEDKLVTLGQLKDLGLPSYEQLITPVSTFLDNPEASFEALDRETYFAILAPRSEELERKRERGLSKEQIKPYIEQSLKDTERSRYDLVLQEFFPHFYGGNIVCDSDGSVLLELIKGGLGHNSLVTSRETPKFRLQRNPLTRLFSSVAQPDFGEIEPDLPMALWKTILYVPHILDGEHSIEYASRGLEFEPGYYEFYLDRRTQSQPLEPFFIDYSGQKAYQLQQSAWAGMTKLESESARAQNLVRYSA